MTIAVLRILERHEALAPCGFHRLIRVLHRFTLSMCCLLRYGSRRIEGLRAVEQGRGTKLHLGSGDQYEHGWINVDLRPVGDVVADVRRLPISSGSICLLRAHDILEHLPADQVPGLLVEWRRLCGPGALLDIKLPNLRRLAYHISYSERSYYGGALENLFGGHRWGPDGAFDTHHWGWTFESIETLLKNSGFTILWNDHGLNMRILCRLGA
jgi:hypothetical protein